MAYLLVFTEDEEFQGLRILIHMCDWNYEKE